MMPPESLDAIRTRARVRAGLDALPSLEDDAGGAPPTTSRPEADATHGLSGRADSWPAPLGEAAYHGVLGDLVHLIESQTEADPAALLVQMLVMFGNVMGRAAHFVVGADVHHLNLFAGVVGQTAKARKGVSRAHAQATFEMADPEWVRGCLTNGLSSGEGLIWAIRDAIEKQQPIKERGRVIDYQTVIEDAGIEDKRLCVVEPELASTLRVMAREGNTLSAVIRQAWDGHDLRTITKNSSARATAPHISIIGHVTRDELLRYLEATEMANGFGNRFLWVCAKRSKELPDGGGPVDLGPHVERVRGAVDRARRGGVMSRDGEAGHLWHHVYGALSAGRPGMLGAMTARAEAQVMRLACLYALGDWSLVVGLPHLRAALEVWRYCFDSAAHLFGRQLGDPTADEILRALLAVWPASLTRREILHDVFQRNRAAGEISRALALLADCRLARSEQDRSGGGRPAERWFACQGHDHNDPDDQTWRGEGGKVVKVVKVVDATGATVEDRADGSVPISTDDRMEASWRSRP